MKYLSRGAPFSQITSKPETVMEYINFLLVADHFTLL